MSESDRPTDLDDASPTTLLERDSQDLLVFQVGILQKFKNPIGV